MMHSLFRVDCKQLTSCNLCLSTQLTEEYQLSQRGDQSNYVTSRNGDCVWCYDQERCMTEGEARKQCKVATRDKFLGSIFRCEYSLGLWGSSQYPKLGCHQMQNCGDCLNHPLCVWIHNINQFQSIYHPNRDVMAFTEDIYTDWKYLFEPMLRDKSAMPIGFCAPTLAKDIMDELEGAFTVEDPFYCPNPLGLIPRINEAMLKNIQDLPLVLSITLLLVPPIFFMWESLFKMNRLYGELTTFLHNLAAKRLVDCLTEIKSVAPSVDLCKYLNGFLIIATEILRNHAFRKELIRLELQNKSMSIDIRDLPKLKHLVYLEWRKYYENDVQKAILSNMLEVDATGAEAYMDEFLGILIDCVYIDLVVTRIDFVKPIKANFPIVTEGYDVDDA